MKTNLIPNPQSPIPNTCVCVLLIAMCLTFLACSSDNNELAENLGSNTDNSSGGGSGDNLNSGEQQYWCVYSDLRTCSIANSSTVCPNEGFLALNCPYSSNSDNGNSNLSGEALSNSSSSGSLASSSSGIGFSSSSWVFGEGYSGEYGNFYDNRDGKTYRTVTIGEQTWMAENLNYNAGGSKCYDNDDSNCAIYGRLYYWETAKTACPSGWILPYYGDWSKLIDYVGGSSTAVGGSSTAGRYLKTTSGWNSYTTRSNTGIIELNSGNGDNTYGFSALPGSYCCGSFVDGSFGNFQYVGNNGSWWSASEQNHYLSMSYDGTNVHSITMISSGNLYSYSVRCLKEPIVRSYSGKYGSVSHGGQTYKTVVIGTQTWMAENLNYNTGGSTCYGNDDANCATYGRLYDWSDAMNFTGTCLSKSCSGSVQDKHKGICPSGWHIPSNAEWTTLFDYVEGIYLAGRYLKATSGWNGCDPYSIYVCDDKYGFVALPGGIYGSGGSFGDVGDYGFWWSASENGANYAYYRSMYYNRKYVDTGTYNKSYLLSVRCLQD